MKKRPIKLKIKSMIIIVIIMTALVGCNESKSSPEYLSITSTTYIDPNTEEMTTSIHQYVPATGEISKVFSFPYNSQYPLGVLSEDNHSVYYTKKDINNRDQIYRYALDSKEDIQLTSELRAVNQIIPINSQIFFIASIDKVLRLGVLDVMNHTISYWGDEDTNVETMAINPINQKIYLSAYSYSKDKESIESQFISDQNKYNMPLFSIYETDYSFTQTKELFSDTVWIRNLLVNFTNNNVIAIYDKEYNSDEASQGITIDTTLNTIDKFELPPQRMQVDGGSFSKDGKGLYVLSVINEQQGVYYYDFITREYTDILVTEDEFINNFQLVQ